MEVSVGGEEQGGGGGGGVVRRSAVWRMTLVAIALPGGVKQGDSV